MRFVGRNDLPELSADPVSPRPGNLWHNTTEGVIKFYDGSTTHIIPYFTDINAPNVGNTVAQWTAGETKTITHNLGTLQLDTTIQISSTPGAAGGTPDEQVYACVTINGANAVDVIIDEPGYYFVTVVG